MLYCIFARFLAVCLHILSVNLPHLLQRMITVIEIITIVTSRSCFAEIFFRYAVCFSISACVHRYITLHYVMLCFTKFTIPLIVSSVSVRIVSSSALTLLPQILLTLYTSPYWSNPPFLIFDIRALWRSGLSARAPECQKLKMVG